MLKPDQTVCVRIGWIGIGSIVPKFQTGGRDAVVLAEAAGFIPMGSRRRTTDR